MLSHFVNNSSIKCCNLDQQHSVNTEQNIHIAVCYIHFISDIFVLILIEVVMVFNTKTVIPLMWQGVNGKF